MGINSVEPARRTVGAAYAKRNCDEVTRGLIASLERETAASRQEIEGFDKYRQARSGRFVFGTAVATLIVMLPFVLKAYWFAFSTQGRADAADWAATAHKVAILEGWIDEPIPARDASSGTAPNHDTTAAVHTATLPLTGMP